MKMKKVFLFALATAMMSFAGCQQMEQEAPVNPNEGGSTFEFVADIAQTKTTLDVANGYKVDWEEGDVVYMVTSNGTWGAPYNDDKNAESIAEFTYADGKFTSEATIADGEYTFKGMYAAASQKSYHRGASSTHKLEATQTQDCANPTAHIKANDALVGTFTATVPMAEMAKMNMSHLYTLMQVNVKNATGAAVNVTKFEMTAAGADLAGIFNVTAFDTPALATEQNAASTITVNVTGGSVENNASLPVYFVMAPLANYAGDVTFKVTDSEGKTYTKTVTMNGITFEAGKYNTTPYTIKEADKVQANVTWDLSKNETSEATATKIAWVSSCVSVVNEKGSAETPTNNYYGGDTNNRTSTRFYKGSNLTIAPVSGYAITSVVFAATSTSYASDFAGSTWTNAVTSADEDNKVTIIPLNGIEPVNAKITGTCGFTSIVVNYVSSAEYEQPEPPVLTSITLSGQKTDYFVDDEFGFDGIVTANYSYGSSKVVTDYTVSAPDMSSEGTKTVTVTYSEEDVTVSESYEITLTVKPEVDQPTDGPLVWTLVTNVSDLAVGDEIIIAAKDYGYAISTTQNTNNRGQAAITKNGNTLDTPETNVQILTLTQGSSSGTFAFYTGSNYLYAASSSSNYLKQQTTLNANASWKVTIANDGTATIVAQGTNTRNTMQYNQSSGLFACYSSASQKALAIYKQMPSSGDVGGTTPDPEEPETPDTPTPESETTVTMTSFSATSASMDSNVSYSTAKGGGTSAPAVNSNQIRLYQNSAGTGGGTITITAKDGYKLSSVTIGSSMATTIAYTIGTSTTKSTSASVSANGKYTVDDINATSITFYCMGTSSSSRLYVNYLSATYVAD